MSARPRCPTCNKPAPAVTTRVWVKRPGDVFPTPGRWERYLVVDQPLLTIEDCRRHSNQQVLRTSMWEHPTLHVHSFTEWDGETYWHARHPFCSNPCAVTFARGAYKAGYRHRRDA